MTSSRATSIASAMLVAFILSAAPPADLSIHAKVNGAVLTIRTSERTAGAIESLVWRGKEFINAHDHGRELQSASSFDGYGECLNPTEAGSAQDAAGPATTSRLVSGKAQGRTLETTIDMAYWWQPGIPYPHGCGTHTDLRKAKNETALSRDLLIKRVTIGVPHVPNAIDYDVTFVTAEEHESATFEALTAYMPPEFSEFLAYDPDSRKTLPLSDGPGEQTMPVILATPDEKFAMGVYSPGLPQKQHPKSGYGRWRFMNNPKTAGWNTVKWNAVYREAPAPAGRYHYHCYVVVGTVEDVRRSLDLLIQSGKARD